MERGGEGWKGMESGGEGVEGDIDIKDLTGLWDVNILRGERVFT